MDAIYLDHNASSPLPKEVIQAMLPWLEGGTGNPTSGHAFGVRCRDAVERARRETARLLGCHPIELYFTGGGTESNNMVIQGLARRFGRGHIVTSAIEHPAVLEVCRHLQGLGFELTMLPVDGEGRLDPADATAALRDETFLVTVMLANNEVGTLQPLREIAAAARERDILVHTDAAQAVGKCPVKVDELGVDLLTVAGHKLNAPKGVGALYVRSGVELPPLMFGAGHERGLRPGTENVLEIVGLGAASRRFEEQGDSIRETYRKLRDRFEDNLLRSIKGVRFNGPRENRLVNTASVSFEGVRVDDLLGRCPGVAASAGAACHADQALPSHVLEAMGFDLKRMLSTVRFSVGHGNTPEEMDRAVDALAQAVGETRGQ